MSRLCRRLERDGYWLRRGVGGRLIGWGGTTLVEIIDIRLSCWILVVSACEESGTRGRRGGQPPTVVVRVDVERIKQLIDVLHVHWSAHRTVVLLQSVLCHETVYVILSPPDNPYRPPRYLFLFPIPRDRVVPQSIRRASLPGLLPQPLHRTHPWNPNCS